MAKQTTLERLCDAFYGELEHQFAEGLEPHERHTIDGIALPSEGRWDKVVIIDGEIWMPLVVVAVLQELRKLPPGTLLEEIDAILEKVEREKLIPKRRGFPEAPGAGAVLSADGRKILTALAGLAGHKTGVPIETVVTKSKLDEHAFVEALGVLEKDTYLSIERQTGKVWISPAGFLALRA